MRERPIPFSGQMVRAILDDRKTQTRRVVKEQPGPDVRGWWDNEQGSAFWMFTLSNHERILDQKCPFGDPSDLLWVREAWRAPKSWDESPPRSISDGERISYIADETQIEPGYGRYRHGKFMPRWACRLVLEVVNVRVERLLAISVDDCFEEGIEAMRCPQCHLACYGLPGWGHDDVQKTPNEAYWHLWDQINEARGYGRAKNPWVWVVEFRRAS